MKSPTRLTCERPRESCFVRRRFILAALGIFGLMADGVSAAPVRIMCVGDSVTVGNMGATWSHPFTFGYRGPLYTKLTNAGYDFQFVGASEQPWNDPFGFGVPTDIQAPDLRTVGQDNHRGYGGWYTSQIYTNITPWLPVDNPDIILLMIGTNGPEDGMDWIDPLVNTIVIRKPEAQLIVAQISPRLPYHQSIVDYNNYIKNTVVPKYQALGKNVTTVDQYTPFLTNPNNPASMDPSLFIPLPDGVHLRPAGNELLAETWFEGIKAVAPVPEPSALSLLGGLGLLLVARTWWRAGRQRTPTAESRDRPGRGGCTVARRRVVLLADSDR